MTGIILKECNVWSETDFTEDEEQKILCKMALRFAVMHKEVEQTIFVKDIETVYLNSMTGIEMDEARQAAITTFCEEFLGPVIE